MQKKCRAGGLAVLPALEPSAAAGQYELLLFTIALLLVCLLYCVKSRLSFNTYQSVLAFFLVLLTVTAKLLQGNPIQNNYLAFVLMLFLLPGVVEGGRMGSFKEVTLFFAVGIIAAALIAQQTAGLPNISKYINVHAYLSITRRSGFYGDPNFYAAHITACMAGIQLLLSREEKRTHQLTLLLVLILLLYCGMLSASKSFVVVTAGLFLVWVPILLEKGHWSSKFRLLAGVLCAGAVVLSSSAFEPLFEIIAERFSYSANISQLTTKRTDLWMDYLNEFAHNIPLTLLGQGYTSVALHGWASHNTIIQSVFQFGLLGVPLLTAWVVLTLKDVQRKLGDSRPKWTYTLLMLVGVVMPWFALDILFLTSFPFTDLCGLGEQLRKRTMTPCGRRRTGGVARCKTFGKLFRLPLDKQGYFVIITEVPFASVLESADRQA